MSDQELILNSRVQLKQGLNARAGLKKRLNPMFTTLITLDLLVFFLSPLVYMILTATKTTDQVTTSGAPWYPAQQSQLIYKGQEYPLYEVPISGEIRQLALYKKGRTESLFLDPANPSGEPVSWQGSYRALPTVWMFDPVWDNFQEAWNGIKFPRLFFNTLIIALLVEIGTLTSCTLVAYGFARFRFPGKDILFTILIATIFLPASVTLVPTYTFFLKIGWVGTWLPLIVPAFFANAYDVFLLRQYFLTIPQEMDEAAMIDGAGPLRILVSIILPQSIPVLVAVGVFTFVWSWNEYFTPLIYLSTTPDLQTLAVGIARFNGLHTTRPPLVQAASLMSLVAPILVFLFAQRAFMSGVKITGVEK